MADRIDLTSDLISIGPAARIIGISTQSLDAQARTGKLSFVTVANRRFFSRRVIEDLAAARTSDNNSVRTIDGVYRHFGSRCVGRVDKETQPNFTAADINKRNRQHYKSRGQSS